MKGRKLSALLLLFILPVLIGAQTVPVKTEIKSVKVYLSGAELFHTAKVKLEKGNYEILFGNIASNFDMNSVSVTGKGNIIITSVGQQYNYLENAVKPEEIKVLEDSLKTVEAAITKKGNERDVFAYEQELILTNRNLAGRQTNVTVAEVQKYADYLRKRITEIRSSMSALNLDLENLNKTRDRINRQLQDLNEKYRQPVNQISVDVTSNAPGTAEFEISYFVSDAGWTPVYEVRVKDINKPIDLGYTAKIRQNTGLDWNNVKLALSSRNPWQSQNKPELYPWLIDFRTLAKKYAPQAEANVMGAANSGVVVMRKEAEAPIAETMADYTSVNEDLLSFEFEASIPCTIPADGKPHSVILKNYELPGTFEYFAAPKMDRDAFLLGHITKWGDLNFLQGEALTYYGNSFIGRTYINPNISKDTLTLSLGRDRGINVERKPLKDYTEDKFLSSDIERTFAYDLIIKNNKNKEIKVTVEDQIPVSKNEDITVKPIELSGGSLDAESGKVKWNVTVEPGKSVTKRFVFSVRYPKDKPVSGI